MRAGVRACGVLALALAGCGAERPSPGPRPTAAAFGPISYFEDHCARCHGSYGYLYAMPFVLDPASETFQEKVREMVVGPAQSSLTPGELDALVAYHRSMVDGRPFIAWTSADGSGWRGEVTPGSTVWVIDGGVERGAEVTGHAWSAGGSDGAVLEARGPGGKTRIRPVLEVHSHRERP